MAKNTTTKRTKYAVISKVEAGWATVYVGPNKATAEQIAARERRTGREVHLFISSTEGEAS